MLIPPPCGACAACRTMSPALAGLPKFGRVGAGAAEGAGAEGSSAGVGGGGVGRRGQRRRCRLRLPGCRGGCWLRSWRRRRLGSRRGRPLLLQLTDRLLIERAWRRSRPGSMQRPVQIGRRVQVRQLMQLHGGVDDARLVEQHPRPIDHKPRHRDPEKQRDVDGFAKPGAFPLVVQRVQKMDQARALRVRQTCLSSPWRTNWAEKAGPDWAAVPGLA